MKAAGRLLLAACLFVPLLSGQTSPPRPGEARRISWKRIIPIVASDQKHIWTFPARITSDRRWAPAAAVAGGAAGLVAADPHAGAYFRRTNAYHGFNSVFTGRATHWATVIAPTSLYVAGLVRKDSYLQQTSLLAGVAAADGAIVTAVMKGATTRLRPADVPPGGDFGDTWFRGRGNHWLQGRGSFPSGHTVAAFSIATVFARRYPERRWAPYLAYGLAGIVGFSRISRSSHFPSDVFMGAALGYSVGRFTVLR